MLVGRPLLRGLLLRRLLLLDVCLIQHGSVLTLDPQGDRRVGGASSVSGQPQELLRIYTLPRPAGGRKGWEKT